jgi:hypothetical protein
LFTKTDYSKLQNFYQQLSFDFEFKVVVFLRHQSLFLYSWYTELVTAWYTKTTAPFSDFVNNPRYPTDYKNVLDEWGAIFGANKINVYLFDKMIIEIGLINHFMGKFFTQVECEILNKSKNHSRVSLAPAVVEKIRVFNALEITEEAVKENFIC